MVVAIVSGAEGTGKTTQVLGFAQAFPTTMWGILELKDQEKIMALKSSEFTPEVLYETYPDDHVLRGNDNPFKTLAAVTKWTDTIYMAQPRPQTIVLDGISDLREYAMYAWILADNADRVAKGRQPRKTIGEKNIGAWGEVNTAVKEIVTPLINLGLKHGINVIMTAQMKDNYIGGDIVGSKPDIKPFMSYPVPCLFTLSYDETGYSINSTKAPNNPRWKVEGIKKETGFTEALEAHNLLPPPATSDYMISYGIGNVDGRSFINAKDEEEARAKFMEAQPEAVICEVTK